MASVAEGDVGTVAELARVLRWGFEELSLNKLATSLGASEQALRLIISIFMGKDPPASLRPLAESPGNRDVTPPLHFPEPPRRALWGPDVNPQSRQPAVERKTSLFESGGAVPSEPLHLSLRPLLYPSDPSFEATTVSSCHDLIYPVSPRPILICLSLEFYSLSMCTAVCY